MSSPSLCSGRSHWPKTFLAASAWIVGARPTVVGGPLRPTTLLISNHVSWLDILVLGGSTGTAFVSKDNLGHGVIHWLADQNATLYVSREDRKGSKDQAVAIARAPPSATSRSPCFRKGPPGLETNCCRSARRCSRPRPMPRMGSKFGRSRSTMARPPASSAGMARAGRTMCCASSAARGGFR